MVNSSTVINALYSFFGKKKNKLTWSGSLEDLKAFVLTIVDEETAESSTWCSPSGGKWCFDSDQLKVTWYTKSEAILFEGTKAKDLSKRIHGILVESVDPKKAKNFSVVFAVTLASRYFVLNILIALKELFFRPVT